MTVKSRLTTFFGLLFFCVISIVTAIGFSNFKSSSIDNYSTILSTQAHLISKTVEQNVGRYFDVLHLAGKSLPVNSQAPDDLNAMILTLVQVRNDLDVLNAYVGLKNGDTYSANKNGMIPNFNAKTLNREWYERIFAGESNIITTPYKSASNNTVMALGVPIVRNNEVIGALCINLPLDKITNFIAQLTPGNQVYASRSDGYVLASKQPHDIGKNIFDINPSYQQYSAMGASEHYYKFNGEKRFVSSVKTDTMGWTFWVWDTVKKINSKSNENLMFSSAIAIGLIIISLIVSYLLVIKLMYVPIGGEPSDIEALIQRIATGDLTSARPPGPDDTGVHAETLKMMIKLREMVSGINYSAEELNEVSEQLAELAHNVHDSSDDQMNQLEHTSSAMNQMTVSVEEVASNAAQVSTTVDDTAENTKSGLGMIQQMNSQIQELSGKISDVVVVTDKLEQETESIDSILDVINNISEQTNLLALNAAIEAARAGEQGRGFAVVADEVRNLATKTKESTTEIQATISRLQVETKQSVSLMRAVVEDADSALKQASHADESLESIQRSITEIQGMNNHFAVTAEEQSQVASNINQSVVVINDLAKHTHQASVENTDTARHVKQLAQSLKQAVVIFKL